MDAEIAAAVLEEQSGASVLVEVINDESEDEEAKVAKDTGVVYQQCVEMCMAVKKTCIVYADDVSNALNTLQALGQVRKMQGQLHQLDFANEKQTSLNSYFTFKGCRT